MEPTGICFETCLNFQNNENEASVELAELEVQTPAEKIRTAKRSKEVATRNKKISKLRKQNAIAAENGKRKRRKDGSAENKQHRAEKNVQTKRKQLVIVNSDNFEKDRKKLPRNLAKLEILFSRKKSMKKKLYNTKATDLI